MRTKFGWVERKLLELLQEYEDDQLQRTAINLTARVYRITPSETGVVVVSPAQHTAVRRALNRLRRKGLARREFGGARLYGTRSQVWILTAEAAKTGGEGEG